MANDYKNKENIILRQWLNLINLLFKMAIPLRFLDNLPLTQNDNNDSCFPSLTYT